MPLIKNPQASRSSPSRTRFEHTGFKNGVKLPTPDGLGIRNGEIAALRKKLPGDLVDIERPERPASIEILGSRPGDVKTVADIYTDKAKAPKASSNPVDALGVPTSHSAYSRFFFRDGSVVSSILMPVFGPKMALATLDEGFRRQGRSHNPLQDKHFGSGIHEHAANDIPELSERWGNDAEGGVSYHGAVDNPSRAVNLVAQASEHLSHAEMKSFLDGTVRFLDGGSGTRAEAMLAHTVYNLARMKDPRGHGYVWWERENPLGHRNAQMADAFDGRTLEDGTLFQGPFASVEIQGIAHDSLINTAALIRKFGISKETRAKVVADAKKAGVKRISEGDLDPAALEKRAAKLRSQFLKDFWHEEKGPDGKVVGFFGSDVHFPKGKPKLEKVQRAQMGELLDTRILEGEDAKRQVGIMVERLFSADFLGRAGIRSMSASEPPNPLMLAQAMRERGLKVPAELAKQVKQVKSGSDQLPVGRFWDESYWNGSTWFVQNFIIARGLERHGKVGQALQLKGRAMKAMARAENFVEFAKGGYTPKLLQALKMDRDTRPWINRRVIDGPDLTEGTFNEKNHRWVPEANRYVQPPVGADPMHGHPTTQGAQAWSVATFTAIAKAWGWVDAKVIPPPPG